MKLWPRLWLVMLALLLCLGPVSGVGGSGEVLAADGTEVTPTTVDTGSGGGGGGSGAINRWLVIGIGIGALLLALGLAKVLKFCH